MRPIRVLLLSAFILLWAAPAVAAAGLESTLTLSDVRPGSKGVIYSWDLVVANPVEARSIRLSVVDGTSGAPSLYLIDGLPAGTLSFDGKIIDYRFDRLVQVPAGTKIIFAVGGLTNPTGAAEFTSQIRLGGLEAKTPPVAFHLKAGTRAMVFVTAEAARLSRDDPASVRSSAPVLMTNEQHPSNGPVPEMTSPWFSMIPATGLTALLIVSALLLITRRTFQVA